MQLLLHLVLPLYLFVLGCFTLLLHHIQSRCSSLMFFWLCFHVSFDMFFLSFAKLLFNSYSFLLWWRLLLCSHPVYCMKIFVLISLLHFYVFEGITWRAIQVTTPYRFLWGTVWSTFLCRLLWYPELFLCHYLLEPFSESSKVWLLLCSQLLQELPLASSYPNWLVDHSSSLCGLTNWLSFRARWPSSHSSSSTITSSSSH